MLDWIELGIHHYETRATVVAHGAEFVWARGEWEAWWLPVSGRSGFIAAGPDLAGLKALVAGRVTAGG